jgi:hypothetical protein
MERPIRPDRQSATIRDAGGLSIAGSGDEPLRRPESWLRPWAAGTPPHEGLLLPGASN